MCLYPRKISRNGKYKENNYNGKKGEEYNISVFAKCGTCIQCMAEKANNWVIRNFYESQKHKNICFVTLTYKENPIILIKRHLQLFCKRLRKKISKNGAKIRFFSAGEYG